jgi:transcription elongation factor GreA
LSRRSAPEIEEGRTTTLSDEGRQRIAAELATLKKRRGRLMAGLASDEDTVGDRGDAADEIQQAEQAAFVDGRIAQLEGLLCGAESARADLLPDGTEVTLRFSDGEVSTMRVVAVVEEIGAGDDETLTANSPLGCALAGHKPGETLTYATPQGQQSVELLAMTPPRQ